MLVGRAAECARVERLLESARQGRSGALIAVGEPGIGKTALLEHAVDRAADMRVLRARGTEAEMELPFAGLLSVLRPVVDLVDALPAPMAAALRGALALGPPATGSRFAIDAATLAILAEAAQDRAVLVVLDDAHLLDPPSAEALVFAVRRLEADGVAVVAAARPPRPLAFEPPTFEELPLDGLAADDAAALVSAAAPSAPSPGVAARLVEATAGNPLGLLELAALLTEDQLAGRETLTEPLPAGASVERAFARHVEALGAGARRALVVAAAGEADELAVVVRAAATLGLAEALEELETAGLVSLADSAVSFRHPLVRSAAYAGATPGERRAAHRALADALTEERHADLRAWHLAAAALGPDEEAAAALERAAGGARSRAGYATAARALESAARLSPDPSDRARRLLASADLALRAGRAEQAVRALEAAGETTPDPAVVAAIEHVRGRMALFAGAMRSASTGLEAAARPIEADDPGRAATMLAEAALAAYVAGEISRACDLALQSQSLAASPGGTAGLISELVLGTTLFLAGSVEEGFRLLVSAADIAEGVRGERPDPEYAVFAAMLLVVAGEYGRAETLVRSSVEEARGEGALGILPFALYAAAHLDLRTGRLTAAYAEASEAVQLAADVDAPLWRFFATGCLALVEAMLGDEESCRRHARQAQEAAAGLELYYPRDVDDALGILELAAGRPEEAILHLERANRLADDPDGTPVLARFSAPDLVEAYVRAGRPVPDAVRPQVDRQSAQVEFAATAALAWRCRGLLAGEEEFDAAFGEALRLHGLAGAVLAEARTALLYGERLRRAGRRVDARVQLRAALETFERLGAGAWAARAEGELRATGEARRRRDAPPAERLTPQELQIALVVAGGATNRETGAALFLSPKTIEAHLGRIYRKLAIRSRTELARLVASDDAAFLGLGTMRGGMR